MHFIQLIDRLAQAFVEHPMGQSGKIAIEIAARTAPCFFFFYYGQVLAMAWKQTNIWLSIEKPLQWRHKKKWP